MTRLEERIENFNKFFTILSDVVATYNKNKNDGKIFYIRKNDSSI